MAKTKELNTAPEASTAAIVLEKFFPNKPKTKKPTNGKTGINIAKLFIRNYHFKRLRICMSVELVFLYTIINIARPTATSAAATAIIKNTNTCPSPSLLKVEKAANNRFTALSINSIDIKTIIAFLRYKTPKTPILNKAALNNK